MSIFFAFAVDSYQESKPGNEKRKSRVLPTDFVLHLNGFFHLVFIHEYTYLFKNWNLAFNLTFCINNKIVTTIR